jgi:hypothetical protein
METGDIQTKPLPYSVFIAPYIPNLQRYARGIFQSPSPSHGVLGHSPVQIRGPLRAKGGGKAGLGFSRLRITSKNDQPIAIHFFFFCHRAHRAVYKFG